MRLIRGNPGKRKLNDAEPSPLLGPPECPAWLSGEMRAEWDFITGQLQRMGHGMLAQSDRALLVAYCEAWADFVEITKQLRGRSKNSGRVIMTMKGNLIQNPLVGMKNKSVQRLLVLAGQFGLSPAARTRVKTVEAEKVDPFDAFLKKSNGA